MKERVVNKKTLEIEDERLEFSTHTHTKKTNDHTYHICLSDLIHHSGRPENKTNKAFFYEQFYYVFTQGLLGFIKPNMLLTLSYLGVFLGSFLYEIPFFVKTGAIYNNTLFLITYILSFTVFAWLLYREKLKLKLWNFMLFFPIILIWIVYFNIPMWIHRLSVFPFFLSLPITKYITLKRLRQ